MKTTERLNKERWRKRIMDFSAVSRGEEGEAAACLPCRFFNIVKIHSEITELKTMEKKMVTVSCQTIWYGLIKKGFFVFFCCEFCEKYRLFISLLSLPPKYIKKNFPHFQENDLDGGLLKPENNFSSLLRRLHRSWHSKAPPTTH